MFRGIEGRESRAVNPSYRLGEYLRARRKLLSPADVGLVSLGRRRVVGLRREEVALLAGISVDYYTRLEQGRQHPSAQVLDALARALRLDDDAHRYLRQLTDPPMRGLVDHGAERISVGLTQLVQSADVPAFVLSRYRRVLLLNRLASVLLPILQTGENQMLALFLDPAARELYRDWSTITGTAVAALRSAAGPDLDDPELVALVATLSAGSEHFRALWDRHDASQASTDIAHFHHPVVGRFDLRFEALEILGTNGQLLLIYYPEPDRAATTAMRELRKLALKARS
jgi:transcriptional regulator with XRE-family HTH domain